LRAAEGEADRVPTFVVTAKMHPALVARVLASVRGREGAPGAARRRTAAWARKALSLLRLAVLPVLALTAGSVGLRVQRQHQDVESERARILVNLRSRGAGVTDGERRLVEHASTWLTAGAAAYEGDFVAPDVRGPGALKAALARPSLYVRGPADGLADPARLAEVAAVSYRDALLLCLVDPPAARTEKAMMAKVRAAYPGSAEIELRAGNVRRLEVAVAGLAFLQPAWEENVRAAEADDLGTLRREIDRAPIETAKLAAKSSALIFAVDEAGEGQGPTEIDGERPHAVRLEIVDLTLARVLLRARKRVDPAWISVDRRPEYATKLDSCAFAFDVLAEVGRAP
jgi:hypothetical protein